MVHLILKTMSNAMKNYGITGLIREIFENYEVFSNYSKFFTLI